MNENLLNLLHKLNNPVNGPLSDQMKDPLNDLLKWIWGGPQLEGYGVES